MSKFIIKPEIFEMFPGAEIGVVVAKGIDNTWEDAEDYKAEIADILEASFDDAKSFLKNENFAENKVIAVWREAFRKFKTKKGARSSIEALMKRVQKDNPPGSINPLVDIYNAVSLSNALPCGGEDIDAFEGDLVLMLAEGGEDFIALGDEESQPALPGEVIYKDDAGAVCRCWNWRDGQRTMLTEDTINAFLILESVDPERSDDLHNALWTLANNVQKYLGGEVQIYNLDENNTEIEL